MQDHITKVKIKKIYTKDIGSGDKQFTALNILAIGDIKNEGEEIERWLNGYENKTTRRWDEGDVVTVKIQEQDRINEKLNEPYLQYRIPDESDMLEERIELLEKITKRTYKMVKVLYKAHVEGQDVGKSLYQNDNFDVDEAMKSIDDTSLPPKDKRSKKKKGQDTPSSANGRKGERDDVPDRLRDAPPLESYGR